MLYPLTFHPIFKERVWGGRRLAELYGKALPPDVPIGESWEITDRPEGVSVIANGPFAGQTLRWLMENHAAELLGTARPAAGGRFPLLVKILDAQDKLSLQVHPPAAGAAALGGEPKTELWYVAAATPDADIFVGLRRGVTRAGFERKIRDGTVAECFHRHAVRRGDAMFLPSGRVHALGAGSVIFEIQQNSDTTYRVFDWNRTGLDGRPRDLHIPQALASIDFSDFEPPLLSQEVRPTASGTMRPLVENSLFKVSQQQFEPQAGGRAAEFPPHATAWIIALLEGELRLEGNGEKVTLRPGQFCLVPAQVKLSPLPAPGRASFLTAELPPG